MDKITIGEKYEILLDIKTTKTEDVQIHVYIPTEEKGVIPPLLLGPKVVTPNVSVDVSKYAKANFELNGKNYYHITIDTTNDKLGKAKQDIIKFFSNNFNHNILAKEKEMVKNSVINFQVDGKNLPVKIVEEFKYDYKEFQYYGRVIVYIPIEESEYPTDLNHAYISKYLASSNASLGEQTLDENWGVYEVNAYPTVPAMLPHCILIRNKASIEEVTRESEELKKNIIETLRKVISYNTYLFEEEGPLPDIVERVAPGIEVKAKRYLSYHSYSNRVQVKITLLLPTNSKGELLDVLVDRTGKARFKNFAFLIDPFVGVLNNGYREVNLMYICSDRGAKAFDKIAGLDTIDTAKRRSAVFVKENIKVLREIYDRNTMQKENTL